MNETEKTAVPAGYMQDSQGRMVPINMIKPIDLARNDLVMEIVDAAREQSAALAEFKQHVYGKISAFVELSAEKYGVTPRGAREGAKGNITLMSFDGRYKVQRAVADNLAFDERMQAAKVLIIECVHEWGEGSRPEIMALVNAAFDVDKEGKINTGRVLGLKRLNIDHPKWLQAMQAIQESIQTVSTKSYVRVSERVGETGQYRAIPLDVAAA